MFLSDKTIREHSLASLMIKPFSEDQLQPASYDVKLGEWYLDPSYCTKWNPAPFEGKENCLDLRDMPKVSEFMDKKQLGVDGIILAPGKFILAATLEYFIIPPSIRASIEGKSSLARLGIVPHIAAGYIDPGFKGVITLEIANIGPFFVRIRPGDKIAQIAFANLDQECERPYGHPELGSHYQNQAGVQGSKYGRTE